MKKLLSILFVACFLAIIGLTFSACSSNEQPHEHAYKTTWSKDETHHWHACETENCDEITDKAEHEFVWKVDKEATVEESGLKHEECECGAKRSENTVIEKLPEQKDENRVSEEEFYTALSFEGVNSYTITIGGVEVDYDADLGAVGTEKVEGTIYIQGDKGHYVFKEPTATEYYLETVDKNTYMYLDMGTGYVKIDVTDDMEENLGAFGMIGSSSYFKNGFINRSLIDFADFIYADGAYTGKMQKDENDTTLIDATLKFENGKLVYFRIDEKEKGYDVCQIFSFSLINSTTVTLPTNFTENLQPQPQPSEWSNYFVLDNVTVKEENAITMTGTLDPIITTSSISIDDEKWLQISTAYGMTNTVYFDGTKAYENGVETSEYSLPAIFSLATLISLHEQDFTETESGVYSAETLKITDDFGFENVTVTIVNGKVFSAQYELNNVESGILMSYKYEFSKWGTTSVSAPEQSQVVDLSQYFVFDNVTMAYEQYRNYIGEEVEDSANIFIEGQKWKYVFGNDAELFSDGNNLYIDGVLSELEPDEVNGILEYIERMFESCKNYMQQGESGGVFVNSQEIFVFKQDYDSTREIVDWTGCMTNVKIVISNDKLVSFSFEIEYISANGDVDVIIESFSFSNWGTTVASL